MQTYLLDKNFLKQLDNESQKEIYAKIISLNIHEQPIESIEGRVTGGSINIDGSSSIRRSCSLNLITQKIDINDIYWGFSNKFKLYIGVLNTIDSKYDDIIWFPQGTYVITSFNSSFAINDYSISISGQDKMCLLNGTLGGNIPMKVNFGIEKYTDKDGYEHSEQRSIHYLIREMIHSFGNEPFYNIIIRDLSDSGLELLSYNGHNDIYILRDKNGEYTNILFDGDLVRYTINGFPVKLNNSSDINYYQLSTTADNKLATWIKDNPDDDPKNAYQVVKCSYGESAGYRMCELVWPDAEGLIANPGDTITSVLDKIVKTFGDYEYFYDLEGHFVFQKKLTYINTSWNNMIRNEEDETYIESEKIFSQYSYSFNDNKFISSFRNTPKIDGIKNDYAIWGKKKGVTGVEIDIHMRYGIQNKPVKYTNFKGETFYANAGEIKYEKRKNPEGLSEDWWAVDDWAEFYKLYTGHYPEQVIGTYCPEGKVNIDLNTIFGIASQEDIKAYYDSSVSEGYYGKWFDDWEAEEHKTYVFDVLPNGKLGYLGHYGGCTHPYTYFLNLKNKNVICYIYKPLLPTQDLKGGFVVDWREIIYQMAQDYMTHCHDDDFEIILARNNPEYENGITGYEQYYTDLLAFWRLLYDQKSTNSDNFYVGELLKKEEVEYYGWSRSAINDPSSLIFWFDLLDPKGGHLQKYSISAIGSRPKIVNDTKVKSIVYKEVPSLIYVSQKQYNQLKLANQLMSGYTYVPMPESFQNYFKISTQGKSAQQVLDESLYECAFLNEKINLQGIPIYYLEPNTKIYVQDLKSGIQGDYIINKITIPLDYSGKMTIEATMAPVKLY